MIKEEDQKVIAYMDDLCLICHDDAVEAGWWKGCNNNPLTVPTKLMLVVSELAEAMEGHRKGIRDNHLPHRSSLEVELADAVIRICDLAGSQNIDLGQVMIEKMNYNQTRRDHKPEVRSGQGGKKY